jgi:nucleotide-binding universal stress UspA family protein
MAGIIVGVDGSENSQQALEWAAKEAALRHAPLTVVAVHQVAASQWTGNPITLPEDAAAEEQARLASVDAAAKATSKLGDAQPASVTVRAVSGIAAQELINASRGADLLVVGAHGGGAFISLLLGSVSSKVVHHAYCPVVVVPGNN